MKLFLTWLLGVPLIVTSMVIVQSRSRLNVDSCSRQVDVHGVATTIPQNGNRISCDRLAIH